MFKLWAATSSYSFLPPARPSRGGSAPSPQCWKPSSSSSSISGIGLADFSSLQSPEIEMKLHLHGKFIFLFIRNSIDKLQLLTIPTTIPTSTKKWLRGFQRKSSNELLTNTLSGLHALIVYTWKHDLSVLADCKHEAHYHLESPSIRCDRQNIFSFFLYLFCEGLAWVYIPIVLLVKQTKRRWWCSNLKMNLFSRVAHIRFFLSTSTR